MTEHTRQTDRGLSPVVGIILMLAITMLLAATVGAFAMGMSDEVQGSPPTTAIGLDYDTNGGSGSEDVFTITHVSGDQINPGQLYVEVDGATCSGGSDDPNGRYNAEEDFGEHSYLSAGMSLTIDNDSPNMDRPCTSGGDLDLSDAQIDIVWQYPDGRSTTLREWEN